MTIVWDLAEREYLRGNALPNKKSMEDCKRDKNFDTYVGLLNYIAYKALKDLQLPRAPIIPSEIAIKSVINLNLKKFKVLIIEERNSLFPSNIEYFKTLPFEVCYQILNLKQLNTVDLLAFSLTNITDGQHIKANELKKAKFKEKVKSFQSRLYKVLAGENSSSTILQYFLAMAEIRPIVDDKKIAKLFEDVSICIKITFDALTILKNI